MNVQYPTHAHRCALIQMEVLGVHATLGFNLMMMVKYAMVCVHIVILYKHYVKCTCICIKGTIYHSLRSSWAVIVV